MSLDNNSTKLIDSSDNNQKSNNCDLNQQNTETKESPDGTSSLNGTIDSNSSVDSRQQVKIENSVNDNNTNEAKGQFMDQKDKSDGGSDVSSDGNKNDDKVGYGILKNGVPDLGKFKYYFYRNLFNNNFCL